MVQPENLYCSRIGIAKVEQTFDQRGFASAIHADQPEAFAALDFEVDSAQSSGRPIKLRDTLELECDIVRSAASDRHGFVHLATAGSALGKQV
jgi:hypothetical protein